MKVYKCDACGRMIENPHEAEMREYTYHTEVDEYGVWPFPIRRKTKIHLCGDCYHGLNVIAERAKMENIKNNKGE